MNKKKALEVSRNFIAYLKELKDMQEFATDEDIAAFEYVVNTYPSLWGRIKTFFKNIFKRGE